MNGHIYLIRNLVNGKGYVGQTIQTVPKRWIAHKSCATHDRGNAVHAAMRKYGTENFTCNEVVSCDSLLLNDLERHYIKFYGTFAPTGHGYNLTEGGETPPDCTGTKRSEETKKRMSESAHKGPTGRIPWNKGKKGEYRLQISPDGVKAHSEKGRAAWTEERKAKSSNFLKGNFHAKGKHHTFSEEHISNLKKALKIRKEQNERLDIRNAKPGPNSGKHFSREVKARMSASHKGKKRGPFTDEHRANIKLGWAKRKEREAKNAVR